MANHNKWLIVLFTFWALPLFAQKKPELFVLAVGIEQYKDPSLNLNYAADDAKDLAAMFKKQTLLWNVKEVKVLTDAKATGNNIVLAMDGFKKKVTSDDYFVFVFSGHGIEGRLVPHDYDNNPYRTTLSKEEILEHLDALGCGYMLFLDACHSGSFAKSLPGKDIEVSSNKNLIDKATKDLVDALSGSDKPYLIFGSSGTNQKSWECKTCGHGYFAQAVLWAFENKPVKDGNESYVPDADNNGLLSVSELDNYLKEAVRTMTQAEGGPQKVYSRLTFGKEINLTAWKDTKTKPAAQKDHQNPAESPKNALNLTDLCIKTNKSYQLGCADNTHYIECNAGFLGPTDFKNKRMNASSSPNAGLDYYRALLIRYEVKNPEEVLALLRLNGDNYMILTAKGIYWTVSIYEQMRWVKRDEYMPFETLAQFKMTTDNAYINLRENGKKKNKRQLLLHYNQDARGLKPAELKAFLVQIIAAYESPSSRKE